MAGRCAEGLGVIAEALAMVEDTGERYSEAELWRVKGELLLKATDAQPEAESCYRQALEIARQRGAKMWELRAATSLSRLWQRQGKHQEARQLLGGDLRLVFRRLWHSGFEGGSGIAEWAGFGGERLGRQRRFAGRRRLIRFPSPTKSNSAQDDRCGAPTSTPRCSGSKRSGS